MQTKHMHDVLSSESQKLFQSAIFLTRLAALVALLYENNEYCVWLMTVKKPTATNTHAIMQNILLRCESTQKCYSSFSLVRKYYLSFCLARLFTRFIDLKFHLINHIQLILNLFLYIKSTSKFRNVIVFNCIKFDNKHGTTDNIIDSIGIGYNLRMHL